MVTTAPYGPGPRPIDAALAAAHDGRPEYVGVVGDEVWWTEPRPAEGGRRALVRRRADGTEESVLPAPWNVRSRVIEYGGQPWAGARRADGGPLVVFVNFADQRLYAYEPDSPARPRARSPRCLRCGGGLRWADPLLRPERGEVWCVLEEFTGDGPTDVRRVLAAVPLDGSAAEDRAAVRELTDDRHRFVTGPRLSPDGRRAAWLAWDHPRDALGRHRADASPTSADDGTFARRPDRRRRARRSPSPRSTGRPTAPCCSPPTAPAGGTSTASTRTAATAAAALCPREEEFGGPLWKVGQRWFAPAGRAA